MAEQRKNDPQKRADDKAKTKPIAGPPPNNKAFIKPRGKGDQAKRIVAVGSAAAAIGALGAATTRSAETPSQPSEPAGPVALNENNAAAAVDVSTGWDIEATKNEQVDFFIDFLQWRNRDKTKVWLERVGNYGPMIHQKLT